METVKKKVDVKAIMDRANKKVEAVKESTQAVKGKTNDFRIVPGLTNYEFNGKMLRNVKTKRFISFKTGRTKYQLTNDKGENQNLSNDEIRALMPVETKTEAPVKEKKAKVVKAPKAPKEPKQPKEKKVKGEIKNHHIPNPQPLEELKPDARKIMSFPSKSYDKVIKLHEAGYSKEEIITITGKRNDVVSKYLRPLLKSKK